MRIDRTKRGNSPSHQNYGTTGYNNQEVPFDNRTTKETPLKAHNKDSGDRLDPPVEAQQIGDQEFHLGFPVETLIDALCAKVGHFFKNAFRKVHLQTISVIWKTI